MFSLREFVKTGLISAIGIQPDYWVILTSANWLQKGVLLEEDLIEIQRLIEEKNTQVEPIIEEPVEETPDEVEQEVIEEEATDETTTTEA